MNSPGQVTVTITSGPRERALLEALLAEEGLEWVCTQRALESRSADYNLGTAVYAIALGAAGSVVGNAAYAIARAGLGRALQRLRDRAPHTELAVTDIDDILPTHARQSDD